MSGTFNVKGWCPGALRPMESGDGLIVRVRPRCGSFSIEALQALGELAATFGNGQIDLTRRANLQLRGLTEGGLRAVHDRLRELDLLDPSPEVEAVRNIVVAPFAGLDAAVDFDGRVVAQALEDRLVSDSRLSALPGKFCFAIDDGSAIGLDGYDADISIRALERSGGVGRWGVFSGSVLFERTTTERVVTSAIELALAFIEVCLPAGHRRFREAVTDAAVLEKLKDRFGCHDRTEYPNKLEFFRCDERAGLAQWIGMPFGRIDSDQINMLCMALAAANVSEVRVSPWRAIYVPLGAGFRNGKAVVDAGAAAGLITDPADPLLNVVACTGAPDCPQSFIETRGLARQLAGTIASRSQTCSVHVSGCAKSCASSSAADFTVVGQADGYGISFGLTASDRVGDTVSSAADVLSVAENLVAKANLEDMQV